MPEIFSKRAFQYYWFGFAFTSSVNYVQYSSQPQQNIAYGIPATGASPSVSQPPVQQQTTGATNPQPPSNELSTVPPNEQGTDDRSTCWIGMRLDIKTFNYNGNNRKVWSIQWDSSACTHNVEWLVIASLAAMFYSSVIIPLPPTPTFFFFKMYK